MRRFAIFTDLDGTLLDHDDYGFEPARSTVEKLTRRGHPLIPVTSKTACEIEFLRERLGVCAPYVAENGCVLAAPPDFFRQPLPARSPGCTSYQEVIAILHRERERMGYRFVGFADMSVQQIAELTGLEEQEAWRASQRRASEPLIWEDTAERLSQLVSKLQERRLRIAEGGRFLHVLGPTDKGLAVRTLMDRLRAQAPSADWLSVGLGDAPNDLPMLDSVDIAVVIPSPRGFSLGPRAPKVLRPQEPGPSGWACAVEHVLAHYGE